MKRSLEELPAFAKLPKTRLLYSRRSILSGNNIDTRHESNTDELTTENIKAIKNTDGQSDKKEEGDIISIGFLLLKKDKSGLVEIANLFFELYQSFTTVFSDICELQDGSFILANCVSRLIVKLDKSFKIIRKTMNNNSILCMCKMGPSQAIIATSGMSTGNNVDINILKADDEIEIKRIFKINSFGPGVKAEYIYRSECPLQLAYASGTDNTVQRICVYDKNDYKIDMFNAEGRRRNEIKPDRDIDLEEEYKVLMTGSGCDLFVFINEHYTGKNHLLKHNLKGRLISRIRLDSNLIPSGRSMFTDFSGNIYIGHGVDGSITITKLTKDGDVYKYVSNCKEKDVFVARCYSAEKDMFVCLKATRIYILDSALQWEKL